MRDLQRRGNEGVLKHSAGALRAAPFHDQQSAPLDVSERSDQQEFADTDLNEAYAVLATRFPEETFSHAFLPGSGGTRKLRLGLASALIVLVICIAAKNFS